MRLEIGCHFDRPELILAEDGSLMHEALPLSADARELRPLIGTTVRVLRDLSSTEGPIIGTVVGVRAEKGEGIYEIELRNTPAARLAERQIEDLDIGPVTRIAHGVPRSAETPLGAIVQTGLAWHAEAVAFVPISEDAFPKDDRELSR